MCFAASSRSALPIIRHSTKRFSCGRYVRCPRPSSRATSRAPLLTASPPTCSNSATSAANSSAARSSSGPVMFCSSTAFFGSFAPLVGYRNASCVTRATISSWRRPSACCRTRLGAGPAVDELVPVACCSPPGPKELENSIICGMAGRGSPRFTGWLCLCCAASRLSRSSSSRMRSASAASSSRASSVGSCSSDRSGIEISTSFTGAGTPSSLPRI
mmetsp:Transcript_16754/g.47687  ORF Transcript_16754/g.47687 Transcript_16754/m.47687 type:complete len:216 (+) Transcript_16754:417-1064(+)